MPYWFSRSSVKFQVHTGPKICRFWPELSVSGLKLQFEFTDGFEIMHKAWHSIEYVPYCFVRSGIKFEGHTPLKNDDLNPVWVRLLGRSQLSKFVPCDLEIWWITLKKYRAPLLCYFKLCASFHSHLWIQTGVTVRKCPIWVKIGDFCPVWPSNLTDDLEKQ